MEEQTGAQCYWNSENQQNCKDKAFHMPFGGRVPNCNKINQFFTKLQSGKPLPGNIQKVLSSDIVRFTKFTKF